MSSHPLLTDNTIALSATLAATIGLEEAILLTVLNDAARQQLNDSTQLPHAALRRQLPFWDDRTIHRVLCCLLDQGLVQLQSELFPHGDTLVYHFAQQSQSTASSQDTFSSQSVPPIQHKQDSHSSRLSSHQPLQQHWQPSSDTLLRLQQHGISNAFAMSQRDSFIVKGQELGANRSDWNHRFFQHVKSQWVYAQNDAARQQKIEQQRHEHLFSGQAVNNPAAATYGNVHDRNELHYSSNEAHPIPHNWQPNDDVLQIMLRDGIKPQFIQDAIPEFVLYWQERGSAFNTWNSKFMQHIRQQWARYSSALEHATVPTRISENWQPDPDCFDILAMGHIDHQFARNLVPEFVLYWRDSNQVHTSWNSRFLQYVKQQWARQLNEGNHHASQGTDQPNYTSAEASIQRLQDTSW